MLVVAGRDSSGRAGIDADLDAAGRFDVEARIVTTADTEQDAGGFRAMNARDPERWFDEAVAAIGAVGAIKIGLLPGPLHICAAARLVELAPGPVVVDPVLSASSGEDLTDEGTLEAFRNDLIPRGIVLTPNIPEAARLVGTNEDELARSRDARVAAAEHLLGLGAAAVLVKGGHAEDERVLDLVLEPDREPRWLEGERIPGRGMRGSGCRYATAVACGLAARASLVEAAEAARVFVRERIRSASTRAR